jgi:hypothetical protein
MSFFRDSFPVLPPERLPAPRSSRVLAAVLAVGIIALLAVLPFTLTSGRAPAAAPAPRVPPSTVWSPSSASTTPTVFDVSQLPRVREPAIAVPPRAGAAIDAGRSSSGSKRPDQGSELDR